MLDDVKLRFVFMRTKWILNGYESFGILIGYGFYIWTWVQEGSLLLLWLHVVVTVHVAK